MILLIFAYHKVMPDKKVGCARKSAVTYLHNKFSFTKSLSNLEEILLDIFEIEVLADQDKLRQEVQSYRRADEEILSSYSSATGQTPS